MSFSNIQCKNDIYQTLEPKVLALLNRTDLHSKDAISLISNLIDAYPNERLNIFNLITKDEKLFNKLTAKCMDKVIKVFPDKKEEILTRCNQNPNATQSHKKTNKPI